MPYMQIYSFFMEYLLDAQLYIIGCLFQNWEN